jgi:ribosome-binding factor A
MQSKRSLKLAELLREEISKIMLQEMKNPKIRMASVTRVLVSPDMKNARIYLNILSDSKERAAVLEAIEHAKTFIRYQVGQRVMLRVVPELRFFYDDTLDYVASIDELLKKAGD